MLGYSIEQTPSSRAPAIELTTDELVVGRVVDLDDLLGQLLAVLLSGTPVIDELDAILDVDGGFPESIFGQVVSRAFLECFLQDRCNIGVGVDPVVAEPHIPVGHSPGHAVSADQLLREDGRSGRELLGVVVGDHQVVDGAILLTDEVLDVELFAFVLLHQRSTVKSLRELGDHIKGLASIEGADQVETDLFLGCQGKLLEELNELARISCLALIAVCAQLGVVVTAEPAATITVINDERAAILVGHPVAISIEEGVMHLGGDHLEVAIDGIQDLAGCLIGANDAVAPIEKAQVSVVELGLGCRKTDHDRR